MTGDTTPQQQAVELASNFLNERFGITMWNRDLDHHSKELVQILADAGLLCSSPVVQPKQDEEGSLRSGPPAAGEVLWAVLPADGDEVYSNRDSAEHCLTFLLEGNIDYRLYEIREARRG
jgi:hypothetical protein